MPKGSKSMPHKPMPMHKSGMPKKPGHAGKKK